MYNMAWQFEENEKLLEYFTKMKISLRSLFVNSSLSDQDYLKFDDNSVKKSLQIMIDIIPAFGLIIKNSGIDVSNTSETTLQRIFYDVSEMVSNYDKLPDNLAKLFTMIKCSQIVGLEEPFSTEMKNFIGPKFIAKLENKELSEPQILAMRDTK